LLTKSIDKGSLDNDLSPVQRKQMLDLLNTFVRSRKRNTSSQRSGYITDQA